MAFIDTIPDAEVDDQVRAMYERQASFWGFVPNYAKVFATDPRSWAVGAASGWYQEVDGGQAPL